ncbi:MAG: hypothetical protein ACK5FT_07325 [Sphingomonadales bacterium]|jgi:tetratricopeptide (TPR) repeat protein
MRYFGSFLLPLLWVAWGCGTRKAAPAVLSKAVDTVALQEMYYAAEFHYIQGNWKQSDSLYRRYTRSGMPPGAAYHRLACIASKNGKTDEALALNAKARQSDTSVEDWMWLDAELYRRRYDYKKAADVYAAYTQKHPRAWSAYSDAARYYAMAGEWNSVLRLCEQWEKSFGLMESIVEYKTQAFLGLGQPEKAADQWAALSRKYPDRNYYRLRQVNALKQGGAVAAAKNLLDTLLAQNPRDYEMIGMYCELNASNTGASIPEFLVNVAQTRGLSFEAKWKCVEPFTQPEHPAYDSSEVILRGLCSNHPNEPRAAQALGLWCLNHGKAGDAAGFLKKALHEGRQSLVLWQQYLTALSMGCETQKMLAESDTLLELYAMNPAGYQMKAIALFVNGRTDEALRTCSEGALISADASALTALRYYFMMQTGKNRPEGNIPFEDSSIVQYAVMVDAEWALIQNRPEDAAKHLSILFDEEFRCRSNKFKTCEDGSYWAFLQCVLQQARLALMVNKNQNAAIALLHQYLPESPVALELMGDLYGPQPVEALRCYEKALACTNIRKEVLLQKINKLKNR